jgi:hypothetical protein
VVKHKTAAGRLHLTSLQVRSTMVRIVEENAPVAVRQTYYQGVSRGDIDKTEAEYKTVVRLLTEMRINGEIHFGAIADNTRWMRKPRSFSSLEDALRITADTYRRATWDNQPAYKSRVYLLRKEKRRLQP